MSTPSILIPERETEFTAVRAQGTGRQIKAARGIMIDGTMHNALAFVALTGGPLCGMS